MRFSFRRPAEPAAPASPARTKDEIIVDLSKDNARLRDEMTTLLATVAYQNGRMREMAKDVLGSQATIGRFLNATETLLSARGVTLPPHPLDHFECDHTEAEHGQWGCAVCDCTRPRSAFRTNHPTKARV